MGQPALGGRNEGFRLAPYLILLSFQGMQVKAMKKSLIHQEKDREKEADILAGEGGVDQGRSRTLLPSFFNSSNSNFMEMGLP